MNCCKKCGVKVPEDAKFCEKCGAKIEFEGTEDENDIEEQPIHKKWWFWLIVGLFLVVFIAVGNSDKGDDVNPDEGENNQPSVEETETEPESKYLKCTVAELIAELDANALNAKEKYKGEYVEITGRVDVIDASGAYISLYPADSVWSLDGVQCEVTKKAQKEYIRGISTGDIVTIRGKITSVGEVLGYYLDIHEFVE